jgi:hypothetical protein
MSRPAVGRRAHGSTDVVCVTDVLDVAILTMQRGGEMNA